MAVYGTLDANDHTGYEWSPCDPKRTSRAPGCQKIAQALGVNYRTRNNVRGQPAIGTLPGPMPPDLPLDQPSVSDQIEDWTDPYGITSSQEEALRNFEGAPNPQRLARRERPLADEKNPPWGQAMPLGTKLKPREASTTSAASTGSLSADALTTWPTISGTIKFPTSDQGATTADSEIATLTAAASTSSTLTTSTSPKPTSAPKTSAASSISCSMQNQVGLKIHLSQYLFFS